MNTPQFFQKTDEVIYPMPIFCLLTVANVQKSTDWYCNALGFRVIFAVNDPATDKPSFVHLRREKYQDILLKDGVSDKAKNAYGVPVTLQAWQDIDELTQQAQQHGAIVAVKPHDEHTAGPGGSSWGTRSVTFEDLDGYRISFTYPTKELLERIRAIEPHFADNKPM